MGSAKTIVDDDEEESREGEVQSEKRKKSSRLLALSDLAGRRSSQATLLEKNQ